MFQNALYTVSMYLHGGVITGAFALKAVEAGSITLSIHVEDLKTVFTASLHDALHKVDNVDKNPANLFVASSGKAVSGIREVMGPSNLPIAVARWN